MVRLKSFEFGREGSDDRVLFFDSARQGTNCRGLFSDGAISADRLAAVLGPIDPMRMLLAQQRYKKLPLTSSCSPSRRDNCCVAIVKTRRMGLYQGGTGSLSCTHGSTDGNCTNQYFTLSAFPPQGFSANIPHLNICRVVVFEASTQQRCRCSAASLFDVVCGASTIARCNK